MDERSWQRLEADPPEYRLPEDLCARDAFGGRDCGWVSQMRPFVRGYSQPGDAVFDPFCGFGTTLLATALEERIGIGMEIDAARASLARERLRRHGITAQIVEGALPSMDIPQRIDLCLTSVPYFGCRWISARSRVHSGESRVDEQLYAAPHFAAYLEGLRAVFHAVREALPEDGYCIAMAENVRIGERTLPVAWELARILDSLFLACDERVLCYPPRDQSIRSDTAVMQNADRTVGRHAERGIVATRSDRTHEYALIYRKRRLSIDIDRTRALLAALRDAMFDVEVHGSCVAWANATPDDASSPPNDLDLWVSEDATAWSTLLRWLCAHGYRLTLWGEPTNADVAIETVRAHGYLRAERIDADGGTVRIDLSLRPS